MSDEQRVAVSASSLPPDFDWDMSPSEIARFEAGARARRRKLALNAAAQVAAPGTPAERVLIAAAEFYDYLSTDVRPVVEPEPDV